LCRNSLHDSGVKRPFSGGTTLAVFGELRALLALGVVVSCGKTGFECYACVYLVLTESHIVVCTVLYVTVMCSVLYVIVCISMYVH
jgi:hypothetical protein